MATGEALVRMLPTTTNMKESRHRKTSALEMLIGLALFDPGRSDSDEIRRYRELGQRLERAETGKRTGVGGDPDAGKIRAWYQAFMPEDIRKPASRVEALLRLASIIAVVLAFFTGAGAAAYFFRYDGTVPINVLPVLVIFALLPLTFFLFSVGYGLWPRRGSGQIPLLLWWMEWPVRSALQKAGHDIPENLRRQLSENWLVHSTPAGHYLRKNLQMAGVFYIFGALLWMVFHVVTTDLAFAWSSTLEMRADTLHAITRTISAPWRELVPSAAVDPATVEATRFYRADGSGFQAISSGRWWPFILMSMVVYGLLPRLLAWAIYTWRFHKTAHAAIASSDSGREILGFMEEALVTVSKDDRNRQVDPAGPASGQHVAPTGKCVALAWGLDDVEAAEIRNVLNRQVLAVEKFGGLQSLEDDRRRLSHAARSSMGNGHCDILILVPFWEAPRLHFEKRLDMLARETPKSRIIILPVAGDPSGRSGADEATWRKRVDEMNLRYGSKRVFLDVRNVIDISKLHRGI